MKRRRVKKRGHPVKYLRERPQENNMARRRRSVRRVFGRVKRSYRRHSGMGGGVLGDVATGAVLGVGQQVATPTINQFVPSFMGLSPSSEVMLGGGLAAKILHKGGKWATAATIIGASQVAQQLASGMGGANAAGGMTYY